MTWYAPHAPLALKAADHADRYRRAVAALVCLLLMSAVYAVAVRTPSGQMIDTAAMSATAIALADTKWTEGILNLISPLSLTLGTVASGTVGYASRGGTTAAKAVGAVAITVCGAQLHLTRPELLDSLANSWPSGHVAAVAGLATLAAPLVLRTPVALAGKALVLATGVATLAQQRHPPSDVIGAALLAVAIGLSLAPQRDVTVSSTVSGNCPGDRPNATQCKEA